MRNFFDTVFESFVEPRAGTHGFSWGGRGLFGTGLGGGARQQQVARRDRFDKVVASLQKMDTVSASKRASVRGCAIEAA